MRIISGLYKGMKIDAPPGVTVRPAMDSARQALFDALGDRVEGARFLDLFAGSGAMGLEALSRGASNAVFVEKDPGAFAFLEKNISRLGAGCKSMLHRGSVQGFLSDRGGKKLEPFDMVFAGPPYPNAAEKDFRDLMRRLAENGWLERGFLVIYQTDRGAGKDRACWAENGRYSTRISGRTAFVLAEDKPSQHESVKNRGDAEEVE